MKLKIYEILCFLNYRILKICFFSKLDNFRNFTIFEIVKFGYYLGFPEWKFLEFSKLKIFWNFPNSNFLVFLNRKFLSFLKLEIFRNFQIQIFWNCPNWKVNIFIRKIQFEKPKFGCKNWKFWNCSSIEYFALLAILPNLIFPLWYRFSQFLFPVLVTRKFGRSTFERSSLKLETSAILKFYCSKFQPSSKYSTLFNLKN